MPRNDETVLSVRVDPSALTRLLGAVAVLIVLANIAGQVARYTFGHTSVYGLVNLTFVDEEHSIPTTFSVLLLAITTLLLALIATLKRRQRDIGAFKWRVLCGFFAWLTLDEGAGIHELLTRPVQESITALPRGVFVFAWIIPATVAVAVISMYFVQFVWRLPKTTRRQFIIAAMGYVGGAIGVEYIGGFHAEIYGIENLRYALVVTVEESLEIGAVVVFIHALLQYLANELPNNIRVSFGGSPEEGTPSDS
jgi:Ca2+/Na+ antiporter